MSKNIHVLAILVVLLAILTSPTMQKQEAPVIGIMTVNDERFHTMDKFWEFGFHSYFPRSYVNMVQLSGAIPVFIEFDLPISELEYLMDNVDGLVMPGADAKKLDYDQKPVLLQERIFWFIEKAKKINDSGRYFPIVSECHGFQAILIYLAGNDPEIEVCGFRDGQTNHPLLPTEEMKDSHLYTRID